MAGEVQSNEEGLIFYMVTEYCWVRSHERALGWEYLSGKKI